MSPTRFETLEFILRNIWCDNLIPGIVAASRWGVELGKLVYWSMFGHVPLAFTWATDQMSRSFPSSRGSSKCPWYTVGGKMRDKNLEQRINIKFCVKIGKKANETLALLTVAYGEYAMKKSSVFECCRQFKEGREDVYAVCYVLHASVWETSG